MLKSRGVEVIFGIPGVHNQEMYRGLQEAGITHVLARHEQGAGFMADGYARATGRPGVAYVITGPGLCNIMTPMGQAYSDSVPLLVVSSCLDEVAARRGQLHQMKDQAGAAAAVCDWSHEARTPQAVYGLIDRAFTEFSCQRARPKHIQVPIAALEAEAPLPPAVPSAALRPKDVDVSEAAKMLRTACRPLFVFGGGAVRGWQAARSVLGRLGAASFTSYAGRGLCDPGDELHFGAGLARPGSAEQIAKADVAVLLGTDLAEVDLWRDHLGHRAPAIVVNIDPEVLASAEAADLPYLADAEGWLKQLDAALAGHERRSDWSAEEVARARIRWAGEVDAERPGIVPICAALRAALPEDTMIYSDMTQFAYVAKEVWPMSRPGLWHHPYGFGTLGYATPAAIGGAVARRGAPTAAIIGDYGFHYTLQELGVAVELGLSLPIILWDNGKLKEIEDSMIRGQIAPNAVIARNPDFCALARAFGAYAAAPSDLDALQVEVRAALEADGPTLIHVTPDILG
jgi:acetolactate synthase-1/2/3 large subunit/5-guanidino-2-oxopentanoate decarboxylase